MNRRLKCLSSAMMLAVFSFAWAACGRDTDKDKPSIPPPAQVKPNPAAKRPPMPPAVILPVKGKVLEILDTGSFVYVALDWEGKKVWATMPGVELKVGEVISLDHASMIKSFNSKTLNRTFDELIFAGGVTGKRPRPREGNIAANPKDPRNRRSGKLMGVTPQMVPPAPVPAKPAVKPGNAPGH